MCRSAQGCQVPFPGCDAVPKARRQVRRYCISSLLRGYIGAVTTCRKRRSSQPHLLVGSGPVSGHSFAWRVRAAVLFARLPDRRPVRLLAHGKGAQYARRTDGATSRRRPVLLLHAGRDLRRQAGLCRILHRRRHRHPQRLHRFFRRRFRQLAAIASLGRRDELSRRIARRAGGDHGRLLARQAQFPAGVRLHRARRPDGNAAGPPRQLQQRGAVWPRHRRAVGDGIPRRRRSTAPPQPAVPGRARRAGAARHHAAVVLEDQCTLSPRVAGGRVHAGHGDRPVR